MRSRTTELSPSLRMATSDWVLHFDAMKDEKPLIEIYEYEGAWGVHEVYSRTQRYTRSGVAIASNCTIYDAMFSKKAAARIAQLLRRKEPPEDWEATKDILLKEGFTDATIDAPEEARQNNQPVRTKEAK